MSIHALTRGVASLSLLLTVAAGFTPSMAETYKLNIRAYCPPSATPCGFASFEDYRQRALAAVHEMNVEFEALGVAFYPVIFPFDTSNPDYYEIPGCANDTDLLCEGTTTACSYDSDCAGSQRCLCVGDCVCDDQLTPCDHDDGCAAVGATNCTSRSWQRRLVWMAQVAAADPDAITLMVSDSQRRCCVPSVPNPGNSSSSFYGLFCDAARQDYDTGAIWAHEMSHYFCLFHPHTGINMEDSWPDEPDHDGDGLDTPPDPLRKSKNDAHGFCGDGALCYKDADCGNYPPCTMTSLIRNLHEYCDFTEYDTDDGSPNPGYCTTDCKRCYDGPCENADLTAIPYAPMTELSVSYHAARCRGPYVLGGQRTEAFSPGQLARMASCLTDVPQRASLVDVCAAVGDTDLDLDGVCDLSDNCPPSGDGCPSKNTTQQDSDGDGLGDVCDPCFGLRDAMGDMDGDCIPDACDPDRDGDGCWNDEDQHPNDGTVVAGTTIYDGCTSPSEDNVVSEGGDTDGDLVRDCKDYDDDNDEVCDGDYAHPYDPEHGVMALGGCDAGPDDCPLEAGLGCFKVGSPANCPPEWQVCFGGSCSAFFIKVVNVSNPDPTTDIVFEQFQIFNRTLYFQSLAGKTVSESAMALQGLAAGQIGRAGQVAEGGRYRMEIWSRATNEVVAVVADGYSGEDLIYGTIARGTTLAVMPLVDGVGLFAEARYARGLEFWQSLADADGDGRPDTMDNCLLAANFGQTDANGNGIGNACDADFDGDGVVTLSDLDWQLECLGADLTLSMPIAEPEERELGGTEDGSQVPEPDPVAYALAGLCVAADLNDDRVVDAADVTLAEGMVGNPPGPSARHNLPPLADAGPDDVVECGGGTPFIDGSHSHDPDGFPVRCFWTSDTCEFETADACGTWVICPPGYNVATLDVSDGTETTSDEVSVFFPACNSPGRVDEPIRIDKRDAILIGTMLEISWEPSCLPGASNYGIYRGTLGDWYSHVALDCSNNSTPLGELVDPGSDSYYFLVVPHDGQTGGSHGHHSNGTERPVPADPGARCALSQSLDACPP